MGGGGGGGGGRLGVLENSAGPKHQPSARGVWISSGTTQSQLQSEAVRVANAFPSHLWS